MRAALRWAPWTSSPSCRRRQCSPRPWPSRRWSSRRLRTVSASSRVNSRVAREENAMDGSTAPAFKVNELTPDPTVQFDPKVTRSYVTYAHRLAARGLVNSGVGGMVIRVAHAGHEHGVCYAKPQGISLEEVEEEDLVITDIPYGRILRGERATTVGHQMNREILRLRPDVNCVIHLHHDETISFMAAGYDTIRSLS